MDESFEILQTLNIQTGQVTSCDFNSNSLLAIGSSDKKVRVLEWKTGLGFVDKCYSPLFSHKYGVASVRFSPKGIMLASSSLDGTTVLYNVQTGMKIFTMVQPNTSSIKYCEFTSDSSKLVTAGDDGIICFWDLVHRVQIKSCQLHDDDSSIKGLAISSESEYLLSADSKGFLKLWFIGVITIDQPQCLFIKKNVHDGIFSCDFSPTPKDIAENCYIYCIATCGADSFIKIWKVVVKRHYKCKEALENFNCNITILHTIKGHMNDVLSVRFNFKGDYLASTGLDSIVNIWEVSTGKCIKKLKGHTRFVTCSAFSKDLVLLATGSNDKTVIIWSLNHGLTIDESLLKPCNVSNHFTNIDLINCCFEEEVMDPKKGCFSNQFIVFQKINSISSFNCVHFCGNNLLIAAVGDKTLTVWKKQKNIFIHEQKKKIQEYSKYNINYLDVSACGTKLITCSIDAAIIFWDLKTDLTYKMRTPICTSALRTCKFSPNSEFIVAAGDDQYVFLWDAKNLEFIKTILRHKDAVTSLAFTPDTKFLVSTCCAGDVKLFCFEEEKLSATLNNAHDLGVTCCDISLIVTSKTKNTYLCKSDTKLSGNKTFLLATCGNDSLVKIWKIKSKKIEPSKILLGHRGRINYIKFSPNEFYVLASCGADSTVRIWNAKSGHSLHILNLHQNAVMTCSFSQDSSMLATGSLDKTILIWTLTEQFCPEVMQNSNKELQKWTTSDIVNWLININSLEFAKKIKLTSVDGKILSTNEDLLFSTIDLENEKDRKALKLQLQWLRKEVEWNFYTNKLTGKNIPHKFLCPITHEIMKNPVICSDGFTYEKGGIIEWFLSGKFTSPMTNENLKSTKFIPNCLLKRNICEFLYTEKVMNE